MTGVVETPPGVCAPEALNAVGRSPAESPEQGRDRERLNLCWNSKASSGFVSGHLFRG